MGVNSIRTDCDIVKWIQPNPSDFIVDYFIVCCIKYTSHKLENPSSKDTTLNEGEVHKLVMGEVNSSWALRELGEEYLATLGPVHLREISVKFRKAMSADWIF